MKALGNAFTRLGTTIKKHPILRHDGVIFASRGTKNTQQPLQRGGRARQACLTISDAGINPAVKTMDQVLILFAQQFSGPSYYVAMARGTFQCHTTNEQTATTRQQQPGNTFVRRANEVKVPSVGIQAYVVL